MGLKYLGIKHDGAENTGVFHSGPKVIEGFLVIIMRSMREVEASDVHACAQKLLDHRHRPGCRSKSANDLRLGLLLYHDLSVLIESHLRSSTTMKLNTVKQNRRNEGLD